MKLVVKDLSVKRGNREILHSVSMEIKDHSLCVMLGQNGSGKTTFVSALCGILPYRGEILLDATPLSSYTARERARLISIVPQVPARATITVEDLLRYGRSIPYRSIGERLREEDLAAIERAIELLDLSTLRRARLDRLSGGELRRAYIAMAFAQDTPVIVLDEPTAHLDAKNQAIILRSMSELREKHGKTVFAVMHQIADAVRYADELILLHEGQVYRQGSVAEILTGHDIEALFGVERYVGEIWGIR